MYSFSIIIPHKNIPNLLQKCLDSIPKREDVQVIVVDDNSDPDIVDLENFPGLGRENTEVYLIKEWKGAGYARNVGLKHAKGKWLVFADADDFFYDSLDFAMDTYKDDVCDVVFFKGASEYLQSHSLANRCDLFNERVEIALKTGNYEPVLFYSSPWNKFINRAFLLENHITFNEVLRGDDIVFMAMIAVKVQSCKASDFVTYCVTVNENPIAAYQSLYAVQMILNEDIKSIYILKKRYKIKHEHSYWFYQTWLNVYKISRFKGICLIPKIVQALGIRFIYELLLDLRKYIKRLVNNRN
jgi:glycosyltransferase involved in cell wall biosynthesis